MAKQKYTNVMILTGKEAVIVPSLAVVGAASLIGITGYGLYKFGKSMYDKTTERVKSFDAEVKKRVKEYYDSL